MVDVLSLNEAQIEQIEEKRAEKLGVFICESRSSNPIIMELRYNYGYVFLRDCFLYGQDCNQFELRVNDQKKRIYLAFIGVGEEYRRKGIGTKMMNTLCSLADTYGYDIDLDVDPKFGVGKRILVGFYKKFGFEQDKFSKDRYVRKLKKDDTLVLGDKMVEIGI